MRERRSHYDVTNTICIADPHAVSDAVCGILERLYPRADLGPVRIAFDTFTRLYAGILPGYHGCDTWYHDVQHSLDCTLALARLIDGHERVCAPSERLGARRAALGVLVAMLHDTGYLRRSSESDVANGAVFTKVHVTRSAEFAAAYLPQIGFGAEAELAARLVHFTGYEMDLDQIQIGEPRDRLLGWMVGTADLIGQMSDRMYLEKCRDFLYAEFVWANIARETSADGREVVRYASAADLMVKTPGFYEHVARARIEKKLGRADRFAEAHFAGPNPYQSEIERNIGFLRQLLEAAELGRLRRLCYSLSTTPVSRPASALSA